MNYQFRARQCPAVLLPVACFLLFCSAHTSAQDLCDVSFDASSTSDHCDSLGLSRGSKSNGTWGTLMQWSRHQGSSGGPDLNALWLPTALTSPKRVQPLAGGSLNWSLATLTLTMKVDR